MSPTYFVIALAGLPGSGKTSIANAIATISPMHILSRDRIKRCLFGTHDAGIPQNVIAFDAICNAVPVLGQLARPFVIDGMTFGTDGQMERLQSIVENENGIVLPIFVEVDIELAKRRLEIPNPLEPVDRNPTLVDRVFKSFRTVPDNWYRLDGSEPPDDNASTILALLENTK
ncbi:AAA family ATPase [Ferrimicrobium acidiphilum]|uniref:AAA family ATPase n=1 Tax=Ferrimicrobium acidiphilum TaxID=121039 RepID=UPI0023F4C2FC|nr:AAA family ATPase [Ferrimicrobium acidiphilum]